MSRQPTTRVLKRPKHAHTGGDSARIAAANTAVNPTKITPRVNAVHGTAILATTAAPTAHSTHGNTNASMGGTFI